MDLYIGESRPKADRVDTVGLTLVITGVSQAYVVYRPKKRKELSGV